MGDALVVDSRSRNAHAVAWPRVIAKLAIVYGAMLLWQCFCITGLGGWSTPGIEAFVILPIAALLQMLAAALLCVRSPARARAWFLVGAVYLVSFVAAMWIGDTVRMLAFRLAGERAAPIVAAIERYVAANGRPPERLDELVPNWLDALPTRVPKLCIETRGELFGNAWILMASTPVAILSFDAFFYLPNQDYPVRAGKASWQRLGRWAYVRE